MTEQLIMGFDYGETKIGIAVGQLITRTANPVEVIAATDGIPDWPTLDKLITQWKPSTLVVGLPLNMDDTTSLIAQAATKFSRRLAGRYQLPVELMDERLSTFEAKSLAPSPDAPLDHLAAKLILETWLQNQ